MKVNDSSTAQQLIDIYANAAKTHSDIGVAILQKQKQVETQQGNAVLQLLALAVPSSSSPPRLDIKA